MLPTGLLILTCIKVVSRTTENFAPNTKRVSEFAINTQCLAKVFTIIHKKFISVDCCRFSQFACLPQRILKWNILKTFLYLTPQETTFALPICCVFFFKQGHYSLEKHARVVCFLHTGHLAVRKGKLPSQAPAKMALIGTLLTC